MKNFLVILAMAYMISTASSQDKLFNLHPIVGDTISYQEKKDYELFSEVSDSNFLFGIVYLADNQNYYLISYSEFDSLIIDYDSNKITEYQSNIEKLSAFYQSQSESDTTQKSINIYLANPGSQSIYTTVNPEMSKQIEKDARRYQALENEAEKRGLSGQAKEDYINSGCLVSFSSKKKKKK